MSLNLNTGISNTEWKNAVKPVDKTNTIQNNPQEEIHVSQNTPITPREETRTTNRTSVSETRDEIQATFNDNDIPQNEVNARGTALFHPELNENVENRPTDTRSEELKNTDSQYLRTTNDDAKLQELYDNGKVIRDILGDDVKKLVKSLDNTLLKKDKIYSKAEDLGKNFMENLDPKSDILNTIALSSKEELREKLVNTVFDLKDKYPVSFEKANKKYEDNNLKIDSLKVLRAKYYKTDGEEKKLVEKTFLTQLKKDFPDSYKEIMELRKDPEKKNYLPLMDKLAEKYNPKPTLFSSLPENKQKLIDGVINGIKSADFPNKATNSMIIKLDGNKNLSENTLPESDQIRLKKYLEQTHKSKMLYDADITIPSTINFKGKVYTYDKLLGGGGDGIAFSMRSNDGEKIVVKSQIREGDQASIKTDKAIEETNESFKKELEPHLYAQHKGLNDNILELKGVIKNGNELFSVTEFAKGGEMTDVIDSLNENNSIPDDIKKLVKIHIMKEGIQGLQFMHTDMNMAHYDIKPSNFFITEDGKVKLADFGKAQIGHDKDVDGGSEAYMPPESLTNNKVFSEKNDVFAIGISMIQVFEGKDPRDIRMGLLNGDKYEGSLENEVISSMISDNKDERPNLTSVLQHSLFNNPTLNNPEVKTKIENLISAVINRDEDSISNISEDLKRLM